MPFDTLTQPTQRRVKALRIVIDYSPAVTSVDGTVSQKEHVRAKLGGRFCDEAGLHVAGGESLPPLLDAMPGKKASLMRLVRDVVAEIEKAL